MLTFKELPIDKQRLADLLARRLGLDLPALGIEAAEVTLRDSVEIWIVKDPASGRPLADQAVPTGAWHHQIWVGGAPQLWMRSRPEGEQGWHVGEIVASPVAAALERAFAELDRADLDAGEIRYLIVPRRQLEAIWVRREGEDDRLIVVAAPPSVRQALEPPGAAPEPLDPAAAPAAAPVDPVDDPVAEIPAGDPVVEVPAGDVGVEVPAGDEDVPRLVAGAELVHGLQSLPDLFGLSAEAEDADEDG